MQCKLCQSSMAKLFNAEILYQYDISYYQCPHCHFIQTEKEYWLSEAYQESINVSDTGYVRRNIILSKIVTSIIALFYSSPLNCIDYAGGYGMFVRMMRDIGYDFYWQDKYTQNLFARGFEYQEQQKYHLLTSFESFEHFDKPLQEIESMLALSDSILFSTVLYGKKTPDKDWHYLGREHGQHIAFYNINSLQYLAEKFNLHLYSDKKNIHLLTKKKFSPLLFYFIVKTARLGLGDILGLFKKSKTLSDWKLIRKPPMST